jgi:hypothetical protein
MNDTSMRELAEGLAQKAGIGKLHAIEPVAGGRNNRVFSIEAENKVVLKCYHHDPSDPRDRLRAEWDFLTYVRKRGVDNVPQPIAADPANHAALYSFIAGARPKRVVDVLVRQAAEFAAAINHEPRQPSLLAPASEACFSLGEHLAAVERRVARLSELDANVACVEQARAFVGNQLVPAWEKMKTSIVDQAAAQGIALTDPVAREIVSPSDFGFHNSLIDDGGRAHFLDFEYAGRDDPAKLICDFFCQPNLPVPVTSHAGFVDGLAAGLGLDELDLWRARLLLGAYRVKWVCIMLNEFSALGARRRAFASPQDLDARAVNQLRAAGRYFDLTNPDPFGGIHGLP